MFELVFGSEAGSVIKNFDLLEPDPQPYPPYQNTVLPPQGVFLK